MCAALHQQDIMLLPELDLSLGISGVMTGCKICAATQGMVSSKLTSCACDAAAHVTVRHADLSSSL